MNNNIRKTEEGFEVEHTDREQLRYAEEQSEPVPDALVNSIVSEESVKGDLLQEQIQKIRERNVKPLADMLIDDLMDKVPADEAIQHDMEEKIPVQDTGVYESLEEIADAISCIYDSGDRSDVWKRVQATISAGKWIADGTRE